MRPTIRPSMATLLRDVLFIIGCLSFKYNN
jgi:hypothetical protein